MSNLEQMVTTIQSDFENNNAPFDDVTFPEQRLLDELPHESMEDRAIFVSMFATFDYNRNANQLVDNIIDLFNSPNRFMFDARKVKDTDNFDERASDIFAEIGFRYPNRDAYAWATNCEILINEHNGRWTELYLSVSADAPSLVERLRNDDFLYLKGDKIAPMYARIVNDDVVPLSNVWDVEIPVDTHIRRLSKDLFNSPDATDEQLRSQWRAVSVEYDIERHIIDGGLWHIGNKWDEWGEDYWSSL